MKLCTHKVTMMSFAINLYGMCCRRRVVGRGIQIVSDISVKYL